MKTHEFLSMKIDISIIFDSFQLLYISINYIKRISNKQERSVKILMKKLCVKI